MAVLTDELLQFAEGIVERVAHQRMNWVAIDIIFYSSFDAYHLLSADTSTLYAAVTISAKRFTTASR